MDEEHSCCECLTPIYPGEEIRDGLTFDFYCIDCWDELMYVRSKSSP